MVKLKKIDKMSDFDERLMKQNQAIERVETKLNETLDIVSKLNEHDTRLNQIVTFLENDNNCLKNVIIK